MSNKQCSRYSKGMRQLALLLAGVLLAACVAGCGGKKPAAESVASSEADSASAASDVDVDVDYDATANAIDVEAFTGTILPETEDAGNAYVDNTLFIGDSNSYRYMSYGFTTLNNDIAVVGMSASAVKSFGCVKFKNNPDKYIAVPEAVKLMQPQRVIIGYGTNDLGGGKESYIKEYVKGIKAICEAYPYCDIIVNAVPPVAKDHTYPKSYVNMKNIDAFNEALVKMCEENGWKFLNSSEALKDTDGFCKMEYTTGDGLHLSQKGCEALFKYIRTHAYETEDRRPKPLKTVPARIATPVDLIVKDPLRTENKPAVMVDISFTADKGGKILGTAEQSVKAGGVTSEVTAVPDEGYEFIGWDTEYSGVSNLYKETITYTVPKLDTYPAVGILITAKFRSTGCEVKFTLAPAAGGSFSKEETQTVKTVSVLRGKDAKIKVYPAKGYSVKKSSAYTLEKSTEGDYIITVPAVEQNAELTIEMVEHEHKYEQSSTESQAPTCTETGLKVSICKECGKRQEEVLPAKGHQFDSRKDKVLKAATCTEEGQVERTCKSKMQGGCGQTVTEPIPATGHKYEEVVIEKPTCVAPGVVKNVCSVCKQEEQPTEVPATGVHTYGDWVVDTPATCVANGSQHHECGVCGAREDAVISATGEHHYEGGVCTGCGAAQEPPAPTTEGG